MDTTKCDHIIGIKENGERNQKFDFEDGEQVDLVKASEYQEAAKYVRGAGSFLDVFKFCPVCGESLDGRFAPVAAPIHKRPAKPDAFEGYWKRRKASN